MNAYHVQNKQESREEVVLAREQVMVMESLELGLVVAETIFKAKVIGKEGCSESKLLIGFFGYKAWQPLSGERWQSASWRNSEERAWLDCPRYGDEIVATWEVFNYFKNLDARIEVSWDPIKKQARCLIDANGVAGITNTDVTSDTVELAICRAAVLSVQNQ